MNWLSPNASSPCGPGDWMVKTGAKVRTVPAGARKKLPTIARECRRLWILFRDRAALQLYSLEFDPFEW